MLLSSLIDAGISAADLERLLKRNLRINDFQIEVKSVERHHLPAKSLTVSNDRHLSSPDEMKTIIRKSRLTNSSKILTMKILDTLISAEAKVHGISKRNVHFHEISSMDTLIDIVGFCICAELLKIDEIYCSPVNIGRAAPAALEIIRANKIPVYSDNAEFELATPTGAAILSQVCKNFGAMPAFIIKKLGFGAGLRDIPSRSNLLSIVIGTVVSGARNSRYEKDEVVLLETNIDDMDPRIYPYVVEELMASGAKDVWLSNVIMKKGRPGIVLSLICLPEIENTMLSIIFAETTTLGIRRNICQRHILKREINKGEKTAYLPDGKTRVKSEFEVSRKKAIKSQIPLKNILTVYPKKP